MINFNQHFGDLENSPSSETTFQQMTIRAKSQGEKERDFWRWAGSAEGVQMIKLANFRRSILTHRRRPPSDEIKHHIHPYMSQWLFTLVVTKWKGERFN